MQRTLFCNEKYRCIGRESLFFVEILRVIINKQLYGFGQWTIILSARGVGVTATAENILSKDIHWTITLTAERDLNLGLAASR